MNLEQPRRRHQSADWQAQDATQQPNRLTRSVYHVARLVLQTETPLSIGAGGSDPLYDNLLVRDANGLPAIPGSSLAGVLRALYQQTYDTHETNLLFGTADRNLEIPSRLQVSWGYLHDQHDSPIEGLREPDALAASDDPLIQDALIDAPLRRDQVKLNHRGVSDAQAQGKFERVSLTAGHRFSVELSLWSDTDEDKSWQQLLQLLQHPAFRLGGNTRRGLGKIKIVRCATGCFKLGKTDTDGAQLQRFSQLGQHLADTPKRIQQGLLKVENLAAQPAVETIKLHLTPVAEGFRFGGVGAPWDKNHTDADATPLIEKRVVWPPLAELVEAPKASIKDRALLFSASSFKGALSHRVAYHCNLLSDLFADHRDENSLQQLIENNAAVKELFGYVSEDKDKEKKENFTNKTTAQVGCLLFDDIYLETKHLKAVQLPHNGIDRFTGGTRDGVLYFEELILSEQPLPPLYISLTRPKNSFDDKHIKALEQALSDLCNGYLALGAGSGRGGYGYFTGHWHWQAGENS